MLPWVIIIVVSMEVTRYLGESSIDDNFPRETILDCSHFSKPINQISITDPADLFRAATPRFSIPTKNAIARPFAPTHYTSNSIIPQQQNSPIPMTSRHKLHV